MLKEIFHIPALLWGPKLGLLVFFVFTVLLMIWVFRPRSKATYKKISASALLDD